MKVTTERIKELRELSGAAIMACRNALLETEGDIEKALQTLKERSLIQAKKKTEREASQGIIESYIHPGGRIGAMIELNCETDFVARTDEFKELAHHIAMQVAAMSPQFISKDDITKENADDGIEPEQACLLLQPYIKSPDMTIQDLITETIAKTGENIKMGRFARFALEE